MTMKAPGTSAGTLPQHVTTPDGSHAGKAPPTPPQAAKPLAGTATYAARLARRKSSAGSSGAGTVEPDHAHGELETLMKRVKPRPQGRSRVRIKTAQRRQRRGAKGAGSSGEDDDSGDDFETALGAEGEAALDQLVLGLTSHGDDSSDGDQRGSDPTDWSATEVQAPVKRPRRESIGPQASAMPVEGAVPRVPSNVDPLAWALSTTLALIGENRRAAPHILRRAMSVQHAYLAHCRTQPAQREKAVLPFATVQSVRDILVAESARLTAAGLPPVAAATLSVPQQHANLLALLHILVLSRRRLPRDVGPSIARSRSVNSHRRERFAKGTSARPSNNDVNSARSFGRD